ncbi:hypothetical protein TNCV_2228191 [Trichonephila clavipes]|nr:hypothetical protein TNCV_2228191 [Trichonephila clavipes]
MSERSFKKICLENRFSTTKVIKSQLQDIDVIASERTVRRKLKYLNFKTCRCTRKSKLTPATKAKHLNWAKHWRDKDVYFWRSRLYIVKHGRKAIGGVVRESQGRHVWIRHFRQTAGDEHESLFERSAGVYSLHLRLNSQTGRPQERVPSHYGRCFHDNLNGTFSNKWIGRDDHVA